MGDRNLAVVPLTISLAVSAISAVTLLGLPAEIYTEVLTKCTPDYIRVICLCCCLFIIFYGLR